MSFASGNMMKGKSAMSEIETFDGDGYEIIAWANSQKTIFYERYGSYQGEWILVSKDTENYFIYEGSYGSCPGCDHYQAFFDYGKPTLEKAKEFAADYKPFLIVPIDIMINVCEAGKLKEIMPGNMRGYMENDYEKSIPDIMVLVKLEENQFLNVQDVLSVRNMEVQQRALKAVGYERFRAEADMTVIDVDGDDQLVAINAAGGNIVFAYVKDSSTPRRYLLRVPPDMQRVKQAIAWTFNLREDQYRPLIET